MFNFPFWQVLQLCTFQFSLSSPLSLLPQTGCQEHSWIKPSIAPSWLHVRFSWPHSAAPSPAWQAGSTGNGGGGRKMAPEQRGSIWHEKWTLPFSLVRTQNSIFKTKPRIQKVYLGKPNCEWAKGAGGKKNHYGAHGHTIKASPPPPIFYTSGLPSLCRHPCKLRKMFRGSAEIH